MEKNRGGVKGNADHAQTVRGTMQLNPSSLVREGTAREVAQRCTNWKFPFIVGDAAAKRCVPFSTQLDLAAEKKFKSYGGRTASSENLKGIFSSFWIICVNWGVPSHKNNHIVIARRFQRRPFSRFFFSRISSSQELLTERWID